MNFEKVGIKPEYRSPQDNVVQDFYIPVLDNAVSYKRSVGFFSSSALVEISKGICSLAKNGGKIELVASPYLSREDEEAIRKGYENRARIIENALLRGLSVVSENYFEKERLNLLANLIESGVLNIKIAFTENGTSVGMYHEKLGLVEDADGNKIAFSGSMNESENAFTKNYETVDVFCSWKSEDESSRVIQKEKAFAAIWGNFDEKLKVLHFPSIDKAILEKYKRGKADFELDKKEFSKDKTIKYKTIDEEKTQEAGGILVKDSAEYNIQKEKVLHFPEWLNLHPYQQDAIDNWKKQNYIGIFDMATGTGKTLTAISALYKLYEDKNGDFCAIILCPYIHLVTQWCEDLKAFGINPIIAFGSSPQKDWKNKLETSIRKRNHHSGKKDFFCLIASIATFKRATIQNCLKRLRKDILLIADEAHYLGAFGFTKFLIPQQYKYRLALSATLERHFDLEGTQNLYTFFGKKCIEYGLSRAIDDGYLTPYRYYPIITTLSFDEKEKYLELSESISREIRIDKEGTRTLSEKGKLLCILRSRIIAGSKSKLTALIENIEPYKDQSNILIYCGATKYNADEYEQEDNEAIRQIDEIVLQLHRKYKMKISKFIAEKSSEERESIIDSFKKEQIQAIAAIKCLDEGVNIPSIKTAFILASSTNPKEYIQRRGRVLRRSKGKAFAEIYDFISLPNDLDTLKNKDFFELENFKTLVSTEVLRIIEFATLSTNPELGENLAFELKQIFNLNLNHQEREYDR